MKKIILLGAGGHANSVFDVLLLQRNLNWRMYLISVFQIRNFLMDLK